MQNNVDNPFKSPAILSLCPGMLGLERGLERAIGSIRTVAYVEIEAFIIENLVQQMEQGVLAPAPVWSDVKTFPFEAFLRKLHWIIGGYPCQPFSHAGTRSGASDPRHLWPFIKSGIKKSRPVGVWFENVEGHLSLGLRDVLADLRKLGYQTEVGIFSAAEVGAPHRRNRVFILGMENSYLLRNGRRDIEVWLREVEIQTSRSGELDHADCIGHQPQHEVPARRYCAECSSKTGLADSDDQWQPQFEGFIQKSSQWPVDRSEELGDTSISGSQRRLAKNDTAWSTGSKWSEITWPSRWPASVGQDQHPWEPPRLESSLGYVLNGYNFREDLLRMAGNAVVEQTAELAFRTLIRKFL